MGNDIPMLHTWKGQPVEELSRDELLEAVRWLSAEYHELMSPRAIRARALGSAQMLRERPHG